MAKLIYLDKNANGKDSILYDYESMKIAVKDKADINDYYNKTDTDKLLDLKLNINDLVAGNNITITKNASGKYEISSTGSGSGSANIDDNNIYYVYIIIIHIDNVRVRTHVSNTG